MRRLDTISRAVLCLLLSVAAPAAAQQTEPPKIEDFQLFDAPFVEKDLPCATEQYQVREGDSLSSISRRTLGSPDQWGQILRLNPKLKNPHLIQPRQPLQVPKCAPEELLDWQNYSVRAGGLHQFKLYKTVQFSVPFSFDEYAIIDSTIAGGQMRSSRPVSGTFPVVAPPPLTLLSPMSPLILPKSTPPADTPPSPVPALPPPPVLPAPQPTPPADTPTPPSPPAPVPAPQIEQVPPVPVSPPTNDATAPANAQPPAERRLHWNAWLEKHGSDT